MISFFDIFFLIITVCIVLVNIHRGFLVSLIGMLRFILIVPLSCVAAEYAELYIPVDAFGDMPEQLVPVITFALCFVLLLILTSLLMLLLKKLQKDKDMPLRNTNAFLGGLFGFLKAAVLVFVISSFIGSMVQYIPQSNEFADIYNSINSSYVIEFVNKFNLFNVFEI